MKKILLLVILTILSITTIAAIPPVSAKFVWNSDPVEIERGETISEEIIFHLPDGFYLYADETELEFLSLEGIHIENIKYPAPKVIEDISGNSEKIYKSGDRILVEMQAPESLVKGAYRVSAVIHYQACSSEVCFAKSQKKIDWELYLGKMAGKEQKEISVTEFKSFFEEVKKGGVKTILDVPLLWLYLIAFIGGILSSFTPCILPLIPVTLLIIGVHPEKDTKGNFLLSLLLIIGMSVAFSIIGVIAASLGISLGFLFQSRLFIFLLVIFFFAMALSLMGLYTFHLPNSLRNFLSRIGGGGPRGAFFSGMSLGILATPCIGPVIAALVFYAASSKDITVGFTLLATYSIGLGLIILIAGTWYGRVVGRLKRRNVRWVKKVIGLILLIPALYYLHSLFPYTTFLMPKSEIPIEWKKPTDKAIVESDKPRMILFSADWCVPCKVLESYTLRDTEIVTLSKEFNNIKVDVSQPSTISNLWVRKYDVKGWPTIIFASPEGSPFEDILMFGGYFSRGNVLNNMKKALEKSKDARQSN